MGSHIHWLRKRFEQHRRVIRVCRRPRTVRLWFGQETRRDESGSRCFRGDAPGKRWSERRPGSSGAQQGGRVSPRDTCAPARSRQGRGGAVSRSGREEGHPGQPRDTPPRRPSPRGEREAFRSGAASAPGPACGRAAARAPTGLKAHHLPLERDPDGK